MKEKHTYEEVVDRFDLSSLATFERSDSQVAVILEKDMEGIMMLGTWKRQNTGAPYKVYITQKKVELFETICKSLGDVGFRMTTEVPEKAIEHIDKLVTMIRQKHEEYPAFSAKGKTLDLEFEATEGGAEMTGWGKSFKTGTSASDDHSVTGAHP